MFTMVDICDLHKSAIGGLNNDRVKWIYSFTFGNLLLYPPHNEIVGEYVGFTPSVCLSIRPACCVGSVTHCLFH